MGRKKDVDEIVGHRKREKGWYVCYVFHDKPELSWMIKVRGTDETAAWEAVLKKLKREGKDVGVSMKYAKCVEE